MLSQCHDYLKQPWIHCGAIDRILVDAMIYSSTLDFGGQVKSLLHREAEGGILTEGILFPKTDFKSLIKLTLWRLLALSFAVIIGLAVSDKYGVGVGILASFIFWFLYMINWYLKKYWTFSRV